MGRDPLLLADGAACSPQRLRVLSGSGLERLAAAVGWVGRGRKQHHLTYGSLKEASASGEWLRRLEDQLAERQRLGLGEDHRRFSAKD